MNIALLAIIIVCQTIISILDMKDNKKYATIEIREKHRIQFYKETIALGWIPVLVILIFVAISPLTLHDIGFRAITFSNNITLNIITCVLSGILALALVYQTSMYFLSANYRRQVAENLNNKKLSNSGYDNVVSRILIPQSALEKKWFLFVSLTAGICEEIVWRGCLIFLLSSIFPSLNIIIICVISCVLFGLAHCYQGWHGIIKTSIVSILFVLIYFTTNSILIGIVLHVFVDFSSAFLMREE